MDMARAERRGVAAADTVRVEARHDRAAALQEALQEVRQAAVQRTGTRNRHTARMGKRTLAVEVPATAARRRRVHRCTWGRFRACTATNERVKKSDVIVRRTNW